MACVSRARFVGTGRLTSAARLPELFALCTSVAKGGALRRWDSTDMGECKRSGWNGFGSVRKCFEVRGWIIMAQSANWGIV